jgi:hypothetical protein
MIFLYWYHFSFLKWSPEKGMGFGPFLSTSKALDARSRGAAPEGDETIRRKEERALARLRREGNVSDDALMVNQGRSIGLTRGWTSGKRNA